MKLCTSSVTQRTQSSPPRNEDSAAALGTTARVLKFSGTKED